MRLARCVSPFATAFAVVLAFSGLSDSWAQAPAAPPAPAEAAAAAPAQPTLGGNIAAVVNDQLITTYDVQQRALLIALTSGVRPTAENTPALLQQALRSLIDERLQLQELRRMEKEQKFQIVADDKEVDESIAEIARDNNKSADQLKSEFAGFGIDISTMREQIRAQTSWQRFISGRFGSRLRIGTTEVDKAMARYKSSLDKPQYLVSEIFIDASKAGGRPEAMEGARQLVAQIQQGAPFAAVARQFSSAATAANGGDMGWITVDELRPELQPIAAALPAQQLSQPVPVSDGVYILAMRDRRTGGGSTMVTLKQAAVRLAADANAAQVADATRLLTTLKGMNPTCADLEAKAGQVPGVVAGQLGETDVNELAPAFRAPVENLAENQASDPVRTSAGMHLLMVCSRRSAAAAAPTREQVEQRLKAEQLGMISRRELRDLRNSATIETP
jgi:peptidyl-prolyl cis-trans isomerase SurA